MHSRGRPCLIVLITALGLFLGLTPACLASTLSFTDGTLSYETESIDPTNVEFGQNHAVPASVELRT